MFGKGIIEAVMEAEPENKKTENRSKRYFSLKVSTQTQNL